MSQLEDLLLKPVTEMTTEELEEHSIKLKKLRFIEPVVQAGKVKKIKSSVGPDTPRPRAPHGGIGLLGAVVLAPQRGE